jgi:hypothetical protein
LDNFRVQRVAPVVFQENHYDPWGLNLKGIEENDLQTQQNTGENRLQSNAGSERETSFDLAWLETAFRPVDAQVGRLWGVDALAMLTPGISPMAFALNNPVSLNDPTGLAPTGLFPLAAFADYENERKKAGMVTAEDNGNGGEKKKEHKAWEKKRDWNQDDFGKFQDFVQRLSDEIVDRDEAEHDIRTITDVFEQEINSGYFQCSQLNVFLLISFAKEEGLPLTLFKERNGKKIKISSENISWKEFSRQTQGMSVNDIRLNATQVKKTEYTVPGMLHVEKKHVNTIFAIKNDGKEWATINASGGYDDYATGKGSFTRAHRSGGAAEYYRNNGERYVWNVFIKNYIKKSR